jgi:hypothetical protein
MHEPAILKKLPLCLNTAGAALSLPNIGPISAHRMTKPRYWSREASLFLAAGETAKLVTGIGDDFVVSIFIGKQTSDRELT